MYKIVIGTLPCIESEQTPKEHSFASCCMQQQYMGSCWSVVNWDLKRNPLKGGISTHNNYVRKT
jgi:hypothetical protein